MIFGIKKNFFSAQEKNRALEQETPLGHLANLCEMLQ